MQIIIMYLLKKKYLYILENILMVPLNIGGALGYCQKNNPTQFISNNWLHYKQSEIAKHTNSFSSIVVTP